MPVSVIRSHERTSAPVYATPQGLLIIQFAPTTHQSVVGKWLIEAGALNVAGVYGGYVPTDSFTNIDFLFKCSAVTGTVTLTGVGRCCANGVELMDAITAGVAFVAGTGQTLSLTALHGVSKCKWSLTVGGGGSVTFALGTDPAAQTALGEFHGL